MVILLGTLDRIKNLDMRRDPNSAKDQIIKGLRPTFVPKKKEKAAIATPPSEKARTTP
jgi:hypothetical protein